MNSTPRKAVSLGEQRRANLQLEHKRSVKLRDSYPSIEHLQISLVFDGGKPAAPSPQLHAFFPAARAFFRFPCPCADCDGDFDLRGPVDAFLTKLTPKRSATARTVRDRLRCAGVVLRDRSGSRPCAMTLDYELNSSPQSEDETSP